MGSCGGLEKCARTVNYLPANLTSDVNELTWVAGNPQSSKADLFRLFAWFSTLPRDLEED